MSDTGDFIAVYPHRHIASFFGNYSESTFIGHDMGGYLITVGLVDGANQIEINAFAILLAKAVPVIAINLNRICPAINHRAQTTE